MISPDYFSYRWSWYKPILDRQEEPAARCVINVNMLPVRATGSELGDFIPYAVHSAIERSLALSLSRLQDYAIRYMVRGEKVSAHTLPNMDAKARSMVSHLRQQHPHLSREMLHHWCADSKGGQIILNLCESLWEQGWKQDQADSAPWVPAINILMLKLIRQAMAGLPSGEDEITNQVMLNVVGSLYVWALQSFLKDYLEGVVEVRRVAGYEAMMLPVTPVAFLRYQQDIALLPDDTRIIRAYGLEPEIVSQLRYLRVRGGQKNEGGMLALLAKDKLGAHLLKRTWARLSLWKLAVDTGHGAWMKWVSSAKELDRLLVGQGHLDSTTVERLRGCTDHPVAAWLVAQIDGGSAARKAGEPWLQDDITLMAFRVFDEDVKVEAARRRSEQLWGDQRSAITSRGRARSGGGTGELYGGRTDSQGTESDRMLEKAWQDGELVFIQQDNTKALHSGKALMNKLGYLRIEWSDYLGSICALMGSDHGKFLSQKFLPGVIGIIERYDSLLLDECSASGCLVRGSAIELVQVGEAIRQQLRSWYLEILAKEADTPRSGKAPPISMCLDMADEWVYARQQHKRLGDHKIVFAQVLRRINAGVKRDAGVVQIVAARNERMNLRPVGGVHVEQVATGTGESVYVLHNEGFMLMAKAVNELTRVLTGKASMKRFTLRGTQLAGVLDDVRLSGRDMELLVIQRHGFEKKMPWLLVKAGSLSLADSDVDVYELLDPESDVAKLIATKGLKQWNQ